MAQDLWRRVRGDCRWYHCGSRANAVPCFTKAGDAGPDLHDQCEGKEGPDGGRDIGFGETAPIGFIVPAGSLGFMSVAVFTICALTTIAVLYYRRVTIGAELGGPKASASATRRYWWASGSSTSARRSCRRRG